MIEPEMQELEELSGPTRVKEWIHELRLRNSLGGRSTHGHYVFIGNPGTGKTTVARLLGKILHNEWVLARGHVVEVGREDLVTGYIGQTALNTKKALEKALDGILFIDEAYSLNEGNREHSSWQEAIDTILAFMENNRNRICVIWSGYAEEMEKFMRSNVGIAPRITEIIHFDDFSAEELMEILRSISSDGGFTLDQDYIEKSMRIFDYWIKNKTSSFGNARDVRKYYECCKTTLHKRLDSEYGAIDRVPDNARKLLTSRDIPPEYSSLASGELVAEKPGVGPESADMPHECQAEGTEEKKRCC